MYERIKTYAPVALLLLLCIAVPRHTLTRGDVAGAFLFHFSHANVWHLMANLYAIALFKPKWSNVPVAYLSATVAALVPFTGMSMPTVGISGMAFAMIARRDAILGIWNWRLLGINLALALIPCYNWKIHLLSYLIAFIIWKVYSKLILNSRKPSPCANVSSNESRRKKKLQSLPRRRHQSQSGSQRRQGSTAT